MKIEENLLNFPCQFPIKIMGKYDDNFDTLVVGIISRYVPEREDIAVRTRLSSNSRYISVTATINATSRVQLDKIYMDLTANDQIIIVL